MSGEQEMVGLTVIGGREIKLDHTRMATDRHRPTVGRGAVGRGHKQLHARGDPRSQM